MSFEFLWEKKQKTGRNCVEAVGDLEEKLFQKASAVVEVRRWHERQNWIQFDNDLFFCIEDRAELDCSSQLNFEWAKWVANTRYFYHECV